MVDPLIDRELDEDQARLLRVMTDAAGAELTRGDATLVIDWREVSEDVVEATFTLLPTNPNASPVRAATGDANWINFTVGREGHETTFELWAESERERLMICRECLEAVVTGRFSIQLERISRILPIGRPAWRVVGTFDLPGGPLTYTRSPVASASYGDLFPAAHERARVLGPHRFPPYGSLHA